MGILLVSGETGAKQAFAELMKHDIGQEWIVLGPETNYEGIRTQVSEASLVLCGMSSVPENAEDEIFSAHFAAYYGIPFGFYADTFGVVGRPNFQHLLEQTNFIFTVTAAEADKIQAKFKKIQVVACGNPIWEKYAARKIDPQKIRQTRQVPEDSRLIISPGGKISGLNMLLWSTILSAIQRLPDYNIRLWLAPHPGDSTPDYFYRNLLQEYEALSQILARTGHLEDLGLEAADLVIQSASTIGIIAACWGIPVIDFIDKAHADRLERITGQRNWPPTEAGASLLCTHHEEMVHLIASLLKHRGQPVLSEHQNKFMPISPEGTAIKKMLATIRQYL